MVSTYEVKTSGSQMTYIVPDTRCDSLGAIEVLRQRAVLGLDTIYCKLECGDKST